MFKIGFMQGRLCEPVNGFIQAFPIKDWEKEFNTAEGIGINLMEWTLDSTELSLNPLLTESGRARILELKNKHLLDIQSLTGDCFMQNPFWKSKDKQPLYDQFVNICEACNKSGIRIIVMPLVDNGTLENVNQEDEIIGFLNEKYKFLKSLDIKIAFESDFAPKKLAKFISRFPSSQFGINYDTGNSASMGFNPEEEFDYYGDSILNIHIKDRLLGGGTVSLNEGNTNFDCIFKQLEKINYSSNFILQTARAKDGDHSANIKRNLEFTKKLISRYISSSKR